ncbi:MAG: small subunit ribosomal protein [Patescibacteria group bacterium]|nr:small subunit ribosomal protein [Patescibacteria group bacterium]
MSRREGVALSNGASVLKVMQRRAYVPGVHGKAGGFAPKLSVYGTQLREKQKAKRLYGIMERQFRNYFKKAASMSGNTGEHLARLLETRLDNTVYRLGFAKTRPQARQMVSHAMFFVNGETVNIPSYQVKVGDIIEVRPNKKAKKLFNDISDRMKNHTVTSWLHREEDTKGKIVSMPQGEDLKEVYDPKLIVEFYSMR